MLAWGSNPSERQMFDLLRNSPPLAMRLPKIALARRGGASVRRAAALLLAGLSIVTSGLPFAAYGEEVPNQVLYADLNGAPDGAFLVSRQPGPTYTKLGPDAFSVRYDDKNYRFYSSAAGGGLETPAASYLGPQLFTGTVDDPVFDEGTTTLADGTVFRLTALTDMVFTLEGAHTARFVLPYAPVYSTNLDVLTIGPFSGTFDGVTTSFQGLSFYADGYRLALTGSDGADLIDLISSTSIFRGGIFLPGGALLVDTATHGENYALSITPIQWSAAPAPVPEPGAWIVMILGATLVGATLRRERLMSSKSRHEA